MKATIGNPARGQGFFARDKEVNKILAHIQSGTSIQISAPRRVGKSSILYYLYDKPVGDYYYVFVSLEGVKTENDFYKKLYKALLENKKFSTNKKIVEQVKDNLKDAIGNLKGIKFFDASIEFDHSTETNYYDALCNFLKRLDLNGHRIVMMVDEFPIALSDILKLDDGIEKGLNFLKTNRSLRQDPNLSDKIIFIYTGSIGLNNIVANMDAMATINDLAVVGVDPLSEPEAIKFINLLIGYYSMFIEKDDAKYLLNRIKWLIPFHIQLLVSEICTNGEVKMKIDKDKIDEGWNSLIKVRHRSYFDHYFTRLKKIYKGKKFDFCIEALNLIASNGNIDRMVINDLATKYKILNEYKEIMMTLMEDGYIHETNDVYNFNSELLKTWWEKYVSK